MLRGKIIDRNRTRAKSETAARSSDRLRPFVFFLVYRESTKRIFEVVRLFVVGFLDLVTL